MDYHSFESRFLRLAFTTSVDLTPESCAFLLGLPVRETTKHMLRMVDEGILELDSDPDGRLLYSMPNRSEEMLELFRYEHHQAGHGPEPHALVLRDESTAACIYSADPEVSCGRATAGLLVNALLCPGMGSILGGRNTVGVAQMSLFLLGLPLAIANVGLPLLAASWAWGIVTGANMVSSSAG
jgi:hypothetical protein